eukprot:jgi/Galph1/2548/GphlegSOOS_G1193.1
MPHEKVYVAENITLHENSQETLDLLQRAGWLLGVVDHPVRQVRKCPFLPKFIPAASHVSGFTADCNTTKFHGTGDNLRGRCPVHSK